MHSYESVQKRFNRPFWSKKPLQPHLCILFFKEESKVTKIIVKPKSKSQAQKVLNPQYKGLGVTL